MEIVNILLVDDRPENLTFLVKLLETLGQNLITASSGEAALMEVEQRDFAVILLDVNLGFGIDGFATASRIREMDKGKDTPIIFLTALGDSDELAARGYSAGAVDFLLKPIVPQILLAKVRVFVELCRKSMLLQIQLDQIGQLHSDVNKEKRATDEQKKLLEQSQAAHKAAEESQRRLSFLSQASALFSTSLDYETTLTTISRLLLPTFADACIINMVDSYGVMQNLITSHIDPEKEVVARKLLVDVVSDPAQVDLSKDVLRTGQSILVPEVSDELLDQIARDDEQLALLRFFTLKSLVFVPLPARGQILGVLSLYITEGTRRFDEKDLALIEEIAYRAAVAVDNARLYRDLQQAVHIRDEFLSVAAHELRTPITSLRGFAELLLRRLDTGVTVDEATLRAALKRITRQSEKLSKLVVQLLNVSRIQAGQLTLDRQPTDIVELVQELIGSYQTNTPTHHFQVNAPEAVTGMVDPLRLEQVLTNLIDNAIKYSPKETTIDVEISLPDGPQGREFVITVTDQGAGIPPDYRANLFAAFYQADDRHNSGMGLGLYISRQIVELHGGQIAVEFPPEGGSRFIVRLPR